MRTVREGSVSIEVPESSDDVFFNPEQELNRDLTVAVLRAVAEDCEERPSYLDAMTASGIRAVRAAKAGYDVSAIDVDPDAVDLARHNLAENDLEGRVERRDANVELHQQYYDVVDLDPFGTPIPFADAAFRRTRDLLCVTATDTAPLCGAHFDPGVRRYSTVPRNTEYHAEMGLRVLLSALARTGARYDVGVTPVLSHATRHYVRTYLRLDRSATDANAAIDALGHVYHCQDCLYRESEHGLLAEPPGACPNCDGSRVVTAGPIWLGEVHDRSVLEDVRANVTDDFGTADRARSLLETLGKELDEPTHYDQHRLCEIWGDSATAMAEFLDALREAGFAASRTHYGGTTFKTDATVAEIGDVIR